MSAELLRVLIEELRGTRSDAKHLRAVIRASATRLAEDEAYRRLMQAEIRKVLQRTHATHALTELGLLSDETLVEGVLRRLGERLAPAPLRGDTLEVALRHMLGPADRGWLAAVDATDATAWVEALLAEHGGWDDPSELASTLVILATRVAGAGMDARLSERVPSLEAWTSPFVELSRAVDRFAEGLVGRGAVEPNSYQAAEAAIARCMAQLRAFREKKSELGTTLRLSSASLRMLQQLERLALLLACTQVERRAAAVAELALQLSRASCQARPTLHFAHQKLELVAYLVVGHAAQRGAKYAVHTSAEYRGFWVKSLVGGFIVAIFACLKLQLSHEGLAPVPQALIYGANYALCFVLIFLFGATLATKQPALTASRLADSLRQGGAGTPFPELVKAVWRSQFVSFLGNIVGAGAFAALFAYGFAALVGHDLVSVEEARGLAAKLHPLESGTVFYAAIAGIMLSTAGVIAGFVDNSVVFHRVADRVRAGRGMFWLVPGKGLRARLASRVEASCGAITGNVALGFMLGSAGAFGEIMGIPFDIRHIAFASSHSSLALWHASELLSWRSAALLFASVSLIGLVNFVVSFALTLSVAINARRLEGVDWRAQLRALWALVKARPASFFLPIGPSTAGDGI